MKFVVVVTAADGTKSVYGPTTSEYRATLASNEAEHDDTIAEVYMLESLTELVP